MGMWDDFSDISGVSENGLASRRRTFRADSRSRSCSTYREGVGIRRGAICYTKGVIRAPACYLPITPPSQLLP